MNRPIRPTRVATSVVLSVALLTSACSTDAVTDEPTTSSTATTLPSETSSETSPPSSDVVLRVLTHDSFALSSAVLDQFEDETGITIELLPGGDTGSLVNQAILTRNAPQGDILFGVDNTYLSRALEADLFRPYESILLDDLHEELLVDAAMRVTPIDYGDVCLNYDKEFFATSDLDAPDSLDDLIDEAYTGLTVVQNPATSSPGLAFLLATIAEYGEDGWETWWSALAVNDVLVAADWETAYSGEFSGGSGEGDRPIVVSYASSPVAEVLYSDPQPDEAPTGVVLAGCYRQVEFAGILSGTAYEEEAQQFIDYLLSITVQEDIPLNMFVYPANRNAVLPQLFVDHALLAEDPAALDPGLVDAHRDDWIESWTDVVLR